MVNDMPGVDGRDVWYPRWSNDPRFITICGPGLGLRDSNVYVGRVTADWRSVEGWVQITSDDHHETAARCWVR